MRRALVLVLLLAALSVWLLRAALAPIEYGIDRRAFGASDAVAAAVEGVVRPIPGSEAPRPNLVVILADDLGYGDLGIQGSGAIATPHLDRLAAEGMRLTHFYASAPVCSPSRAGLLTGRYPLRSGITTALHASDDTLLRWLTYRAGTAFAKLGTADIAGGTSAVAGLPPSEITLAEALRVAGYRSMAVGKWHLGDFTELPEFHPSNHGFDRFVGFNMSNDDWPVAFWRDRTEIVPDIGLDQAPYTGLFTEEAVAFIEASAGAPFFLYLAHKDPHQPFFPSAAFAGRSAAGPYGDVVSELDWSVGEVIAALQRAGVAENTLVVFTSDNGPWFEGSPGALRGRKGQSYEGGFRVPFIAWWPGRVPANAVREVPAMNIDLFPTLLALAGLSLPDDRVIDGADLWAVLSGQATGVGERPLYFFHDYDVEALRVGRWKYIDRNSHYTWPVPLDKPDTPAGKLLTGRDYRPPGAAESVPTLGTWPLLYDLERDPGEAYNVAESHPERARALEERLEAWRAAFRENPRGWR
ncbi:MAG: sulfatase [Deltaproteobacteria bacterium]|nr:MAG: sulfatase [Deltaproteobacteria bacterium]